MYFDALSYLEDEREAWRPYEALLDLTPEQLETPVAGPDRWSGRDLLSHLLHWQSHALAVAKELAVGERSATWEAADADWDARGGDVINDEAMAVWRALPLAEVLDRARTVPGELRGYLTVVPEMRWVKSATYGRFFEEDVLDHYGTHEADLREILAAVAGASSGARSSRPPAASGQTE